MRQLRERESDDVAVEEQMRALKEQRGQARRRVLSTTAEAPTTTSEARYP